MQALFGELDTKVQNSIATKIDQKVVKVKVFRKKSTLVGCGLLGAGHLFFVLNGVVQRTGGIKGTIPIVPVFI